MGGRDKIGSNVREISYLFFKTRIYFITWKVPWHENGCDPQ